MQAANADSVLGDFSDVTVRTADAAARFFVRDGKYFARTRGQDGKDLAFEVTHTFGVSPLQQYLVDAPRGRKQVLPLAWDSRPVTDGGQRWFDPAAGGSAGPDDPMHWTGRYFNWNQMCAECHSTNVDLGYEAGTDTFATTWAEVSVGCEACHGPGSRHANQARHETFDASFGLPVNFAAGSGGSWRMNDSTGIAERQAPRQNMQEPETCGRCHSRRRTVTEKYEYGTLLADTHMVSLLEESLYFPDGRMKDEVYVYGSFIQSKMYAAGVVCCDCHNPHSGELHAGPNPNDSCSTCHLPAKFASTGHNPAQVGDCVSCHMSATTYMAIDDRRDHSFRLPGTATDPGHYGAVIAAGRKGDANKRLFHGIANRSYPAIARATMLALLEPVVDAGNLPALSQQFDDPDALVRIGALRALRRQAPGVRAELGCHLLRDPVRSVRIEAALTCADVRDRLPRPDSHSFADAADEFRASMAATLAVPGAAIGLAEFESRLGRTTTAESMYRDALQTDPEFAPAQYGYGLHLVRSGKLSRGLGYLERATQLAPSEPAFVYAYGLALNSLGQTESALSVLQSAHERFPGDFNTGWALATMLRDVGDYASSMKVLSQLEDKFPGNEQIKALRASLRGQ